MAKHSLTIPGMGTREGSLVTDYVCLEPVYSSKFCAFDVEFFAVTKISKQSKLDDGMFGLAPRDSNSGPAYIEALYK